MGNVFVSEMKKNFDEDKFLIMREALSKDSCNQLTNAFEKFNFCFIRIIVSRMMLVINPLIIAKVIIPKTGKGIFVS